ncbi:MAG: hypothetical protein LBC96_05940 [Lachnospiraceae bacterium]|jgi:tetratricopeptide (TPR) repeat protein|nr:hypothetical protein [Lachnospiraceae bacterium]
MADYSNLSLQQLLNHKNDSESWYWLGMAYMGNNDPINAIVWLEKAVGVMEGVWKDKATQELAIVYMADGHAKTNKAKALELFKKYPERPTCNFYAGLILFYDYNEKKEGRRLVELAIDLYRKHNADLDPFTLSRISNMYRDDLEFGKAKVYLQRAVELCDALGEDELKSFIIQDAIQDA